VASVWVPFTSESKEAIASYPEIQKEIRLALQAVGRKLGMYLRRRLRVAQEGQRRSIFLRYLGEVATAVSQINGTDRAKLYEQLLAVAKKRTAEADVKLDDRGRPIQDEEELELGDNCIIVPQVIPGHADGDESAVQKKPQTKGRKATIATVAGDEAETVAAPQPRAATRKAAPRRPAKQAAKAAAKKPARKPAQRR
jgi:DNA topoisomerase-6 subunit B